MMGVLGKAWLIPLLGASLLGGCICPDNSWAIRWEQPGIYERLPMAGELGGFNFSYQGEGTSTYKQGLKKIDADYQLQLVAYDDTRTRLQFFVNPMHEDVPRPSNAQMRQWLEESFKDLGLELPQTGSAHFRGLTGGC